MSNVTGAPTVEVPLVLEGADAKEPIYASAQAAGCDFYATESVVVKADTIVGLKLDPIGYYAVVDEHGQEVTRLTDEQAKELEDRIIVNAANFGRGFGGFGGFELGSATGSFLDTLFAGVTNNKKPSMSDLLTVDPVRDFKLGHFVPSFLTTQTAPTIKFIKTGEELVECAFNDPDVVELKPKKHPAIVGTGVKVALPDGVELELRGRSGLGFKHSIAPHNGTIDADYRGEIKVKIYNHSSEDFTINVGDRIAQGVVKHVLQAKFVHVDQLPETERGAGGFESTGRN